MLDSNSCSNYSMTNPSLFLPTTSSFLRDLHPLIYFAACYLLKSIHLKNIYCVKYSTSKQIPSLRQSSPSYCSFSSRNLNISRSDVQISVSCVSGCFSLRPFSVLLSHKQRFTPAHSSGHSFSKNILYVLVLLLPHCFPFFSVILF